jgi:hypothetical protein
MAPKAAGRESRDWSVKSTAFAQFLKIKMHAFARLSMIGFVTGWGNRDP